MNKKALLISCYHEWYENRLKPIKEYLIGIGYDVEIILSDFEHINKTYISNPNPECNYIHVPRYNTNISIQRIWSHICFGKQVSFLLKKLQPDLIYQVLPPNNTACYCAKYKKQHPECKYIVDVIDLWPESLPLSCLRKTFPAKIWADFRNESLKLANHVFLECGLYKEKLKDVVPNLKEKSSVLYLFKKQTTKERELVLKTIEEYEIIKAKFPNKIRMAYLGSINNIIDVDGICDVVKNFLNNGQEVEVRIIGEGQSRNSFLKALESSGAEVNYYGKIFDENEKIKILGICDFGLNMMKDNIIVGLTIKSIDYFSMGLPIINNIKGDTWDLVHNNDLGLNINSTNKKQKQIIFNKRIIFDFFEKNFSKSSFIKNVKKLLTGSIV